MKKEVLVDTNFFRKEGAGANDLQGILATVITKSIKDRINEELIQCANEKTGSHWAQFILPSRITMLLCRPSDDRLLQENEMEELRERINGALYNENYKSINAPMVLYFEILERHFLFKRVRGAGSKKNEDHIMMVFYESTPEQPDERLQEITREILKSSGIFALIK
jgi:hypothetical protein